jgi:hypothetical protein
VVPDTPLTSKSDIAKVETIADDVVMVIAGQACLVTRTSLRLDKLQNQ